MTSSDIKVLRYFFSRGLSTLDKGGILLRSSKKTNNIIEMPIAIFNPATFESLSNGTFASKYVFSDADNNVWNRNTRISVRSQFYNRRLTHVISSKDDKCTSYYCGSGLVFDKTFNPILVTTNILKFNNQPTSELNFSSQSYEFVGSKMYVSTDVLTNNYPNKDVANFIKNKICNYFLDEYCIEPWEPNSKNYPKEIVFTKNFDNFVVTNSTPFTTSPNDVAVDIIKNNKEELLALLQDDLTGPQ